VFFAPIPEKGISDFIAHGSIIQVFTVYNTTLPSRRRRGRRRGGGERRKKKKLASFPTDSTRLV